MSDKSEAPPRCEFSFDPERDSDLNRRVVFSEVNQSWRCPRASDSKHNGDNLCIFHLPTSQKQSEKVRQHFVECVSQAGAEIKRFVGAKFDSLLLPHAVLGSNDNSPIDLRHATFENDVNITGTTISQPLFLTGSEINGELKASGATFSGPLWAQHLEVNGGIKCSEARFLEIVNFRNSEFDKRAKFNECRFKEDCSFYGCEFKTIDEYSPEDPRLAQGFHQPILITFSSSTFSEGVNLNSTIFHGFLSCKNVTSEAPFRLSKVELLGKANSLQHVPENMDYDTENDQHGNKVAEITGEFSGLKISPSEVADPPSIVSLKGANIESGTISQNYPERLYYDLTEATLGDIQLKGMDEGNDWEHLIFNKTDIDGLNFTDYRKPLKECGYDICKVRDPDNLFDELDTQTKKNTYLKARIGADAVRAYSASSEFHIHELDAHLTHLSDNKERLQYAVYRLYSFSCRYGERPSRVLVVFIPLLLFSYAATNVISIHPAVSVISGILLTVLPPIFSGLLVLTSSRYIGD